MEMIEKKLKVSVCVVTYNQENYIRQCLQSIVDQETDFDFEVIVADDCSTDNTRAIIQSFVENYPGVLKPVFHEKNIGAYKNFLYVHAQAAGKYIAHMDGDDYALPGKLDIQAKFLDENIECNVLFHRMNIRYVSNGILLEDLTDIQRIPKGGYTRSDILRHISVGANSSKMYRAAVRVTEHPEFNIVDYFETVEQVGEGRACYVNDRPYGVYRAGIGIASSGSATRLALCNSFLYFANKYPKDRKNVNAAALLLFLADLKNKKPTWVDFFTIWLKTFHLMSIVVLFKNRRITEMLRLPARKEFK